MNTNVRTVLVLAALGLAYLGATQWQPLSTPSAAKTSETAHAVVAKSNDKPTPEQQAWAKENLLDVLDQAALNYPVDSIREQVRAGLGKIQSKQIGMTISLKMHPAGHSVTAAGIWDERSGPTILWFYAGVRYLSDNNLQDRQQHQDEIVLVFLHELFHLEKQPPYKMGELTREVAIDQELAAWWWTIENVQIPMRQHDRYSGKVSLGDKLANQAYFEANGDQQHPAWRRMGPILSPAVSP